MDTEHEFEVWQNGGSVAWVNCGDRARAVAEISHYAAVYSKDGPVEVFEVKRVPFDPARSEAQPSGYDGLAERDEMLSWLDVSIVRLNGCHDLGEVNLRNKYIRLRALLAAPSTPSMKDKQRD